MDIQIIRSRRRTLALELRGAGTVLVRAPLHCPRWQIDRFVAAHAAWIETRQARLAEAGPPLTAAELQALKTAARRYFPARAAVFAPLAGVEYGRITIRSQRSRWGSCSEKGNLSFNCLLMLAPEAVRDYVIVHELCHRLEMNHSPRFWAQVERVLPDYRAARRWLKAEGGGLMARLPVE